MAFFDNTCMTKNFWRHLLCDLSYLIKATRRLIKNQKWRGLFKFPQILSYLWRNKSGDPNCVSLFVLFKKVVSG
jgi:hypothetical protein